MADALSPTAIIVHPVRLTVALSGLTLQSVASVKTDVAGVFAGTSFTVEETLVPAVAGQIRVVGVIRRPETLPANRNFTGADVLAFLTSRLSIIGFGVDGVLLGREEGFEPFSLTANPLLTLGVVAVIVVALVLLVAQGRALLAPVGASL